MKSLLKFLCVATIVALAGVSCTNDPNDGGKFKISFITGDMGSAKAFVGDKEVVRANAGDIVSVKAEANEDYLFTGWSSDPSSGFENRTAAETTFLMPSGDVVITASFSREAFALDFGISALASGTVTVEVDGAAISTGAMVESGKTVTVKAEAATGHEFGSWMTEPEGLIPASAGAETTFTMPSSAVSLTADFVVKGYPLTFAVQPAEGGDFFVAMMEEEVLIESGDLVPYGTILGAEYEVSPGYVFAGWSSDEIVISEGDKTENQLLFTMPGKAARLTANFARIKTYALNITPPSNGTVSVTVDGEQVSSGTEYQAGVEVLISAAPAAGYLFAEWNNAPASLDVIGTGIGTARFFMPEQAVTIGATFEPEVVDDNWVEIAGAKWAKYNVGAPGQFVENEYDYGMLYQFGKTVGWSGATPTPANGMFYNYVGENPGWGGGGITAVNDPFGQGPCPDGYRLPTFAQYNALFTGGIPTTDPVNGVNGRTFTIGEASVFFPYAGFQEMMAPPTGAPGSQGMMGFYWTDDVVTWSGVLQGPPPMGKAAQINGGSEAQLPRPFLLSVRCVKSE